jgi:hypothetical protein
VAQEAIDEAKTIMIARETLRETTAKINQLQDQTSHLLDALSSQLDKAYAYLNMDFLSLDEDTQMLLGAVVNNTYSLAALLNKVVE